MSALRLRDRRKESMAEARRFSPVHELDRKLGMLEERALSMLPPKTHKSGPSHSDDSVQAAAIGIQNKFRGYKGRKDYLITRQRIIKIQAYVRAYLARKAYRKIIWSVGILEKVNL